MYTQVQSSFTSLSLKQAINIENCLALMGIRHYKVYVTGGPENLNKQKLMTQSSRNGKYFNPTWIPKYHMIPVKIKNIKHNKKVNNMHFLKSKAVNVDNFFWSAPFDPVIGNAHLTSLSMCSISPWPRQTREQVISEPIRVPDLKSLTNRWPK